MINTAQRIDPDRAAHILPYTPFSPSLAEYPAPTNKDEAWRFTPLRRLRGLHNLNNDHDNDDNVATHYYPLEYQFSVINADGAAVADLQDVITCEQISKNNISNGNDGSHISPDTGYEHYPLHEPLDRSDASVVALTRSVTVITLQENLPTGARVDITVSAPSKSPQSSQPSLGASLGHLVIHARERTSNTVVLHYHGEGTISDIVEIIVDDDAHLECIIINDLAATAVHLGAHYITVKNSSTLNHYLFQFGAELERIAPVVKFRSPGAQVNLYGCYCAGEGQFLEQHLLVYHQVPHCASRVLYKGVLHAHSDSAPAQLSATPPNSAPEKSLSVSPANTVWVGDVHIAAQAIGTDTYEENHNIILSRGPYAHSIPKLEIETGNIVSAGHATTVGRFNDDQLFYLRSRGIPELEAKKLVLRGFFHEIITKITDSTICRELESRLDRELTYVGA